MLKQSYRWLKVFWLAGKRLYVDLYTYRASALAFTTLLAIVPLVSVVLSIMTFLPVFSRFIELAENYIFSNFIPTSSTVIQKYFQAFITQATHLPTIGILFLLFTAVTLIIMVEHTLNAIWSAPKRHKKFIPMMIYWIVICSAPIFIGLSVFLSTYVFSVSWFAGTAKKFGLTIPLLASLPLLINTLIFSAVYIVIPNCKVRWRDGLFGGLIASILFEGAKKGFAFYVKHFPSYELIYGTMSAIPIFLIWVYISWLIILYGALVTHAQFELRKQH